MSFLDIVDHEGRFGEWLAAGGMFLASAVVLLPSSNTILIFAVAALVLVAGILRMVALYINGAWYRTPMLRGIGAIVGGMFFAGTTILAGRIWLSTGSQVHGLAAMFSLVLMFADLRGCYRAGMDDRTARVAA